MKRVLVTGGAGFIGSHLVDRLLQDDFHVVVVDNFSDFYDPAIKRANISAHVGNPRFELFDSDISDAPAMNELFERARPDTVIHLAARAGVRPSLEDPLGYERTNVRGTYSLLEAARRHRVNRFVFGSSSSVYGISSRLPFAEDDPTASPISPYAATKLAGESACHAFSHLYGLQMVCLRFFTVYGARQRPDLAIHKFAKLIEGGKPVPVFGDGSTRRDYTYIDDIVNGVIAAMNYSSSPFEVINLGESETIELIRLVRLLEEALGKKAIIDEQPLQPGDVPVTYASVEKARRLLGYNPGTRIETGISRFVDWFRTAKR